MEEYEITVSLININETIAEMKHKVMAIDYHAACEMVEMMYQKLPKTGHFVQVF